MMQLSSNDIKKINKKNDSNCIDIIKQIVSMAVIAGMLILCWIVLTNKG